MPEDADKSTRAHKELIRVLEAAVWAGVESVGLEWKESDLLVFHNVGNMGYGATMIAKELTLEVIAEIVSKAKLARKHKGSTPIRLLGEDYCVMVEEYEHFGESAYTLTLSRKGKNSSE
jgi:hypothetical protein